MTGTANIKPQAYYDLNDVAEYIQRDSPHAAIQFLANAEATIQSLAKMPGVGSLFPAASQRLQGLRCFPNHLIFFQQIEGGINVIRILHGARDLGRILEESG